jgi:hypothetical protein
VIVLGVVSAALAAAWPAVSPEVRAAVLCGAALAAANTVAAYFLTVWSIARSPNVFLGVVLGGMGVRMALMLAAVAGAVRWMELPAVPVAISLLAFFVPFLAFELTVLHRRTSRRTVAQ